MKAFFASVCVAAVAAGILTATAATRVAPPEVPAPVVNRAAKADRAAPAPGTILVRTVAISPAAQPADSAARSLIACDPLVSPLADPVASRRARQCAT